MNRIEHLKETLPHNIELISKFDAELVLVNYDSKDNMDEYVTGNYKDYLSNKTIKYIRIYNKKFFDRFHAKNIAHRFTNGDILVNLDVDNFLTEDVILFILSKFSENAGFQLYLVTQLFNCSLKQRFHTFSSSLKVWS